MTRAKPSTITPCLDEQRKATAAALASVGTDAAARAEIELVGSVMEHLALMVDQGASRGECLSMVMRVCGSLIDSSCFAIDGRQNPALIHEMIENVRVCAVSDDYRVKTQGPATSPGLRT